METIEISIKGKPVMLKYSPDTAELFSFQLSAILQQYPDNFTEYAAYFRPPALAYCGYNIHCKDTGQVSIIPFDDFCEWADEIRQTNEGYALLNKINELYTKTAA